MVGDYCNRRNCIKECNIRRVGNHCGRLTPVGLGSAWLHPSSVAVDVLAVVPGFYVDGGA